MQDAPILICYDDTAGSRRAIEAAAELLAQRRAVVLDVFPPLTLAQNQALVSTGAPGASFRDDNEAAALEQASAGVMLAREAGFTAEARAILAAPAWEGITQVADRDRRGHDRDRLTRFPGLARGRRRKRVPRGRRACRPAGSHRAARQVAVLAADSDFSASFPRERGFAWRAWRNTIVSAV